MDKPSMREAILLHLTNTFQNGQVKLNSYLKSFNEDPVRIKNVLSKLDKDNLVSFSQFRRLGDYTNGVLQSLDNYPIMAQLTGLGNDLVKSIMQERKEREIELQKLFLGQLTENYTPVRNIFHTLEIPYTEHKVHQLASLEDVEIKNDKAFGDPEFFVRKKKQVLTGNTFHLAEGAVLINESPITDSSLKIKTGNKTVINQEPQKKNSFWTTAIGIWIEVAGGLIVFLIGYYFFNKN